jgi:oxygen-independent coproporphyrinogen III oxidase
MAGIYVHIPFCKQACNYCNFHFSTSLKQKNDFVAALLKEIDFQKEYLGNEPVGTIYFGGGTPSLLTETELNEILQKIYLLFPVDQNVEVTLEANPDDICSEKLAQWTSAGVNRLSIGVQSFFEEDLIWMNRAHNARQAVDSIKNAQDKGFGNITMDLIYGLPEMSNEHWKKNVETAIALNIPHLSCYALTIEPKTALHNLIAKKKVHNTEPDKQAEQFLLLMEWLENAGYEHYEISNFAKPGKRSRHNSSYWKGKKYLGLGPSAHSYNGTARQWNIANNALYSKSLLKENKMDFEKEELSQVQKLNEYIMTSLRTIEGCDLNYVEENFGEKVKLKISKDSAKYLTQKLMTEKEFRFLLTREGKLLADGIASDLFFENL